MIKRILRTVFIMFFAGMMCSVSAQKSSSLKITGKVTDSITSESLVGVSVYVKGTQNGTTTDINGDYSLNNLTKGQVLVFSFIGYKTQEIPVGASQVINVILNNEAQQIKGVVITAQAKGQRNAIRQQINSNTIKNVVAPDRLQENPDANATEAIGRLPGISVIRSGGEGAGLVIRGLEPKYTSVTLNGMQLPSTDGSGRGTSVSGISQYALQGVEVFKSLTADMEANSVAGTVNLKLREAPDGFHVNLMTQGGYNQLNDYWGNYKLLGEVSNRFFDNKLGALFSFNAERVNRSIQTMSAGYGIDGTNPEGDILLNAVYLNDISSIIYRRSLMLSLDYKLSKSTTLMLYSMYTNSKYDNENQAKSYGMGGAGYVGYNFSASPNNKGDIFQSSLSGESKLKFLDIKADYGIGYSLGNNNNIGARSWAYTFNNASSSAITDIEHRKLKPSEVVPLFSDNPDNFLDCWLNSGGSTDSKIADKNLTSYLNVSVPFKLGELITGSVKFGGMYRVKNRTRDDLVGSGTFNSQVNVISSKYLSDSLDWIVLNNENNISAIGFTGEKVPDFLNGDYNFGYKFNMDRLNELTDEWNGITQYFYDIGPEKALPIIFDYRNITYAQDVQASMLYDQDIRETYAAGYIMPEINFGKYVMLLPGVRLENTHTTMQGFYAMPPQYAPTIFQPIPGQDTSATRSDKFILPMIHLRIKPMNSFYMHFAYTQTLSRPDFNAISPNYYVNSGWSPFVYIASNPGLKPELWTNYDAQLTFHGNKVGLLSVTAFYKTVEDKIWNRSWVRIKGDPLIAPFPDASKVSVTVWENHPYTAYVKGLEFEWQTSFSYLPKPFNFFTLSANYTYAVSKTTYPFSELRNVIPPGGGKPITARFDSTTTGPLLYQPKNIANVSLGFNYKGFNAWVSYQYNGLIYTGKNYRGASRLDTQKDHFYRWDLQLAQKFSIKKVKGFEVLANIANISDFTESQRLTGDPRPTYLENYGMTIDLGLRFRF